MQQPQPTQVTFKKVYTADEKSTMSGEGFFDVSEVDIARIVVMQPVFKDINATNDKGEPQVLKGCTCSIMYNLADISSAKPELMKFRVGMRGLQSSFGTGVKNGKISVRIDMNSIFGDDGSVLPCTYTPIIRDITEAFETQICTDPLAGAIGLAITTRKGVSSYNGNVKDLIVGSKIDANDLRMYPQHWMNNGKPSSDMRFVNAASNFIDPMHMRGTSFKGTFVIHFNNIFSLNRCTFKMRCHPAYTIVESIVVNSIKDEHMSSYANSQRSKETVTGMASTVSEFVSNIDLDALDNAESGRQMGGVVGGDAVGDLTGMVNVKSLGDVIGRQGPPQGMPQQQRMPAPQGMPQQQRMPAPQGMPQQQRMPVQQQQWGQQAQPQGVPSQQRMPQQQMPTQQWGQPTQVQPQSVSPQAATAPTPQWRQSSVQQPSASVKPSFPPTMNTGGQSLGDNERSALLASANAAIPGGK